MRNENIIGRKYNYLTVLEKTKKKDKYGYMCKCDCGNKKFATKYQLTNNIIKSCGCKQYASKYGDLLGKRFGKLVVVKEVEKTKYSQSQFLCQCDCGKEKVILATSLTHGVTTSCGCNKGYVENTKINLIKREEAYPNSKSGIKGVWKDTSGHWRAIITVSKKRINFYGGSGDIGLQKCISWRKEMVEKYHKPLIEKYSD